MGWIKGNTTIFPIEATIENSKNLVTLTIIKSMKNTVNEEHLSIHTPEIRSLFELFHSGRASFHTSAMNHR